MLPSVQQLCESPASFLGDIAALNLVCASDLPGSEELNIDSCLATLDEWTRRVRAAVDVSYEDFIRSPGLFQLSQGYFCALTMITVLQRECGVRYNPNWLWLTPDKETPPEFGSDSKNIFIHAIIDGTGGTCGTLPVLYVAIGRRLGWPLKLVKAHCHLFVRWDDPDGKLWGIREEFNIEASGQGLHTPPDKEYRTWPHPITDEELDSGIYLTPLTPEEECAEFLGMRGRMLLVHDRPIEALQAYGCAAQLFPKNTYFSQIHDWLRKELTVTVSTGSYYIPPGREEVTEAPRGPQWMNVNGKRYMVQVPQPFGSMPNCFEIGFAVRTEHVHTPDGQMGVVAVPIHGTGQEMHAEWVRLRDGRYALVHFEVPPHSAEAAIGFGQPGLPIVSSQMMLGGLPNHVAHDSGLGHFEKAALARELERTNHQVRPPMHLKNNPINNPLPGPHLPRPAGHLL